MASRQADTASGQEKKTTSSNEVNAANWANAREDTPPPYRGKREDLGV